MTANFTEAPASINIKTLSPTGYDVMLTLRDSDTGELLARLNSALGWLEQNGYQPTTRRAQGNGGAASASAPTGPTPVCQYHGPMKESTKKPGSFFCPNKMGDGSYCKETA